MGKSVLGLGIALPFGKGHANGEGHTGVVSGFTLDFTEETLGGLILPGQFHRPRAQYRYRGRRPVFRWQAIEIFEGGRALLSSNTELSQLQIGIGVTRIGPDHLQKCRARLFGLALLQVVVTKVVQEPGRAWGHREGLLVSGLGLIVALLRIQDDTQ